jgi:RNA recognition motif-containing protein
MSEAGKKITRKDRKKAEASARLDATLHKLEAVAERAKELEARGETDVRHDLKHVTGTFWKERKEKKKRTLFVGALPSDTTTESLRSLIEGIEACEATVETIDFVGGSAPVQRLKRPRNAFVCFTTLYAASAAQQALDGLQLGTTRLRVNFSADSNQRTKAIEKRSAPTKPGWGRGPPRSFARSS